MRRIISVIATVLLAIGCCGTLRAEPAPRTALAALAMQLPEVKFDGTRLADAIDSLRDVSNANFHVDWRQIETIGVSRDTPVSFTARRITLRKALTMVLAQTSNPGELSFYNDGGVIEVTTKAIADDIVITRLYDVTDLLIPTMSMSGTGNGGGSGNSGGGINSGTSSSGGGRGRSGGNSSGGGISSGSGRSLSGGGGGGGGGGIGGGSSGRSGSGSRTNGTTGTNGSGNNNGVNGLADDLIAIIMDTIEPNVWQVNGGTSTIRYFQGSLIITAPRRIHERIGGYFE